MSVVAAPAKKTPIRMRPRKNGTGLHARPVSRLAPTRPQHDQRKTRRRPIQSAMSPDRMKNAAPMTKYTATDRSTAE